MEEGLPNPLANNFKLDSTLRGIRRQLGDKTIRKLPITPQLLRQILAHLDLESPQDAAFWAASLCMFFGLLRRSNALYDPIQAASGRFLKRSDMDLSPDGVSVHITWSKTNQFGARTLIIPLPRIYHHPLCPTQAYALHRALSPSQDPATPAFSFREGHHLLPLKPNEFVKKLRDHLAPLVPDSSEYAGHSFRRGGAVWAFYSGVNIEAIRLLGDWRSDSYKVYLDAPAAEMAKATVCMAVALDE